jgi:hypothetical protein
VTWLVQYFSGTSVVADSEITDAISQLQILYSSVHETTKTSQKRRSSLLSPIAERTTEQNTDILAMFTERNQFANSVFEEFASKTLKLMVTLSGLLSLDDYRRLGPLLWDQCLENPSPNVIAPACFLIMQCAEKTQMDFMSIVEADLCSSQSSTKLQAILKISTLCAWRFQILSQHVIVDRAHRRPFKLARGPLPFVATDVGSPQFVRKEDPDEIKDNLPLELRKRLFEIGWTQEDKPLDEKLEWVRTPMSLLPGHQLDRLYVESEMLPSPNASPNPSPKKGLPSGDLNEAGLLRRKSSTTGGPLYGMKRRAILVPALATIFPRLATLVFDSNITVASAARNTIMDLMRNDPTLISRPVLDLLAEENKDIFAATSTLQAILHVRRLLPPAMAHHLFNNVTGFLKHDARQVETTDTLNDYAHALPVLSKLVGQVSEMSIREIRRAKVEILLIPSGSLWFSSSAPTGPMFPRSLGSHKKLFDAVPPDLASITIIRLSQNMLFLSMLKRNPQDVQIIRKNMSRLVLPSLDSQFNSTLELKDFMPRKTISNVDPRNVGVKALSLMLSRSYLLLLAQVFRSMSRHLNDRNELAILIDGLNRILLLHGDDIGIVAQAMIGELLHLQIRGKH